MFFFNGQIISSNREKSENDIIEFDQLSIDLSNLATSTIKSPKLQETSTIKLLSCFHKTFYFNKNLYCSQTRNYTHIKSKNYYAFIYSNYLVNLLFLVIKR